MYLILDESPLKAHYVFVWTLTELLLFLLNHLLRFKNQEISTQIQIFSTENI